MHADVLASSALRHKAGGGASVRFNTLSEHVDCLSADVSFYLQLLKVFFSVAQRPTCAFILYSKPFVIYYHQTREPFSAIRKSKDDRVQRERLSNGGCDSVRAKNVFFMSLMKEMSNCDLLGELVICGSESASSLALTDSFQITKNLVKCVGYI